MRLQMRRRSSVRRRGQWRSRGLTMGSCLNTFTLQLSKSSRHNPVFAHEPPLVLLQLRVLRRPTLRRGHICCSRSLLLKTKRRSRNAIFGKACKARYAVTRTRTVLATGEFRLITALANRQCAVNCAIYRSPNDVMEDASKDL
jgi:hypothetical protein